ncbi:hypothetical protein HWQ46_11900 [Shewanella sp. D64]|uniref:hypothetical protein n=1 Tax=unclassified Shewanella TaxID=196818 RepID=UPI0022BA38BF|nr:MULTISPECIES: hypothetical protein [unclassified Shewanella]MEC4726254.1 hypothetical protein [Shewanella sp. D64]MEC4738266.1 hypothetical protein [Shewanella sp. E94]WBJ95404.1 hypothetical protein HWQ47_27080 [Shewanella sp. MTB7]
MESIISIDELLGNIGTPEYRLKRYQACLNEFEKLNYDDPFIRQIRAEVSLLEKIIKETKASKRWLTLR